MLNPAHVLETALLLLVAFLVGATVGSLAKMLALRLAPAAQPASAAFETKPVTVADAALVVAPAIDPVAKPSQPEAPAEVPTPDFSEIARALGEETTATPVEGGGVTAAPLPAREPTRFPDLAPARVAGKVTAGHEIPSPWRTEPRVVAVAPGEGPPPAPVDMPDISAISGEQSEAEPARIVDDAATSVAERTPVLPAVAEAPATVDSERKQDASPVATPVEDETAAMRAIEGTWTPRRSSSRRARKVPAPEGVVAEEPAIVAEQGGRPVGIEAARGGAKDSLTNIIGVLPVIEKALNKVGVYHYDQLGQFSDENVAWLEGHLGIPGRIDREQWREQARELAVIAGRAPQIAE